LTVAARLVTMPSKSSTFLCSLGNSLSNSRSPLRSAPCKLFRQRREQRDRDSPRLLPRRSNRIAAWLCCRSCSEMSPA
jgi:hypothetical protein